MIKGLGITTVWTFDQQRTKAFFTEKLGLSLDRRVDAPQMGLEIAVFRLGDGSTGLELMRPTTESGPFAEFLRANPSGALHHVAYATSVPLTEAAAQLRRCGRQLASSTPNGPIDAPPGWRIVNVDPSGTQGLLTQLGEH